MWVLFATTINHGLSWVKRNWMVSAVAGLAGGPMAFYAGSGLGAITFSDPLMALTVIGLGWGVLLPLLVLVSDTITDSAILEPDAGPAAAGDRTADLREGSSQNA